MLPVTPRNGAIYTLSYSIEDANFFLCKKNGCDAYQEVYKSFLHAHKNWQHVMPDDFLIN